MAARPQQVWECIKPVAGGLRTQWDQNVKDFEVVEAVSDVSAERGFGDSAFLFVPLTKQPTSLAGKGLRCAGMGDPCLSVPLWE